MFGGMDFVGVEKSVGELRFVEPQEIFLSCEPVGLCRLCMLEKADNSQWRRDRMGEENTY